jgi:hypothetical protein
MYQCGRNLATQHRTFSVAITPVVCSFFLCFSLSLFPALRIDDVFWPTIATRLRVFPAAYCRYCFYS